ncbi:YDG domain-containing protein, partial [Rhizobium sp. BR 314]|uniref:YDG domain-containing protein n=1 Tax=Rhizobium sp. BR 314 TaxID=3040013 RepID=UPI0039BF75F9
WSDDLTRFAGTITAKGGAISGNGGEAEVSGKAKLSYTGLTDLTAAHGSVGNLLLDPYNVTISTATDSNSSGFTATGNDSIINVNTLTNALATANVTVTTGSSSDTTNPQAGIITVAAPIAWASGSTLTLNAASDININAAITATTGGLTLASGGTISAPAAVSIGGTFNLTSGNWVQNTAALPTFSAKDFQLTGGSFLRVTGGDGSSATPYTVADVYGLQGIGSSGASLAAKWTLANNIDASGTANWNAGAGLNPIGTYSVTFSGVFDGASHIITGLTVNRAASFLGLFGNSAGTIQNIGLTSEFINGYSYTGGLVGNNTGTINNAFTTGTVNGIQYVGGLTGWNSGSINNSSATTAVSGSYDVGGLVGHNHGSISNSYAAGATYGSNTYAGGLAGFNDGTIKFAYATGSVSGNTYVGGLVGYNDSGSSIDNAYATGAVSGSVAVGGLVGRNFYSTITNSFWDVFTTGLFNGSGQSFFGMFRAIGLTTEQMRDSANNATNYAGWDFANTWYQSGNMRPILRSEAATANANGIATINNLHQLALISVNPSGNYVLSADIDASATAGTNASGVWDSVNDIDGGWQPIVTFTGSLDGAAHTISGLTSSSGGLFGTIGGGASVSNLSLKAADIKAYTPSAAMLASANAGSITSVSVSGTVLGGLDAGGLVGSNSGTIISSSASGSVTGSGDLGGLVANNSGSISGSSTSASVTGETYGGSEGRGGLIGRNSGTISNSFATGILSDLSAISWGGLVGINTATGIINQSYASGSANIAYALYSGGLVGLNDGSITQSYATGGIGGYANEFTGGLAGYNTGIISQSYALGSVSGSKAGGLVGYNTSTGQISHSYAAVSASRGGLAAFNDGTITNSFWNLTVSGRPAASGGGSGTITGTTGLTTDQMANPFLFIDAGWDFGLIWAMSKTGGAPVLRGLTSDPIFNYYVRLSGNTSSIYGDVASASGIALDGYGTGNVSIGWGSAANVGTYAYGDANVLALSYSTGVASDYYIDYGSGSLTINKRVISLSGSRTYDGTTNVSAGNLTLSNLANGETLTLSGMGSMADKNAGSGKAVSLGSLSLDDGSGLASNYTLVGGTDTVDIARAAISSIGGITSNGKTYDGSTAATLNTGSAVFNGMLVGDSLTLGTGFSGAFSDRNAGAGKTVTISGLLLNGTDAGNYTLALDTATTTADITKATISSITGITASGKTYDGTTSVVLNTSGAGFSGMVGGDVLTVATSTGAFADKNAGTGKVVNISGLTLGGADAGNYTLALDTATTTADIARATITSITGITANNKTYDSNTTATLNTSGAGFTGMLGDDVLTVATATGAFSDKNAGAGKTVGITGLTLGGTDAGNYTLTSHIAATTADIAKAYVAFGGTSVNTKTYDGTTAASVNIYTIPISGDDMHVGYTSANFSDKNAGTSKTVAVDGLYITGADAGNYQLGITSTTSYGTITPAIITSIGGITAGNKTYDGTTDAPLDTSGAVFNGIIQGDSLTVATALGAFSDKNVGAGKMVDISGLTLGGADAYNYRLNINTASAFANIGQRVINLSGSRTYNGSVNLDASIFALSNLVSGETLALSGTGTMAEKNAGSGKAVTLASLMLGDSINGDGGLASNYTLIGGADTVDIARATISSISGITAGSKTYDGNTGATLDTSGATFNGIFGNDVLTVSGGLSVFADANAGSGKTVTISGLGLSGADADNYTLADATGTTLGDIARRAITVTANGTSRAYGDANPALSYGIGGAGLVTGDSLPGSLATAATTASNVGSYAISQGTLGNANYAITYSSADLTVTPRAITVAANAASRAYGDANPALSYAIGGAGLVNNDTLSGSLTTSATPVSNVGLYGIRQGTLAASGNYALTFTSADLTVSKRAITVAASNATRIYGDANPALSYTIGGAGLVNGDGLTGGLATSATAASGVGSYDIGQGSLAASGNYDLTFLGGNLAVTPRAITVAANGASRTYGDADPTFTYVATGLVNGDTLAGDLASAANRFSNVGFYTIGLGSLGNANYAISYTGARLTITPRLISAFANNASRAAGAANPLFTYTIGGGGLVNGDRLFGQLASAADRFSIPGSYAIDQGSLAASANYDLSFVRGMLTVTAAPSSPAADLASAIVPRSYAPDTAPPLPPAPAEDHGTFSYTDEGRRVFLTDPRFAGTVVCLGDGAGCVMQATP